MASITRRVTSSASPCRNPCSRTSHRSASTSAAPASATSRLELCSALSQRSREADQAAEDEDDLDEPGNARADVALIGRLQIAEGIDGPRGDEREAEHRGPACAHVRAENPNGRNEDDEILERV